MKSILPLPKHSNSNNRTLVRNSVEFTRNTLLDLYYKIKNTNNIEKSMNSLCYGVESIRNSVSVTEWKRIVKEELTNHPIERLLREDPYMKRIITKPRGYDGDAVMVDLACRHKSTTKIVNQSSEMGKKLYNWSSNCAASKSLHTRANVLASYIDKISDEVNKADILSVACGHMREALFSKAVTDKSIGRLVGLDTDPKNLSEAKKRLAGYGFEAWNSSFTYLVHGKKWYKKMCPPLFLGSPPEEEKFDLIYSGGLFENLSDRTANILTRALFYRLKPDGRLVIANTTPSLKERGIAEGFLNCWITYRNSSEVENFMKGVDSGMVAEQEVFFDSTGNIAFLSVKRT